MDIKYTLQNMTLDEKCALVAGQHFKTVAIERVGVGEIAMADGPHGLRKIVGNDKLGLEESVKATSFPTAVSTASGWNTANAELLAGAIAEECLHYGVDILLGPGINIKKNPLCGRNFEYFSEDPLLAGKMGAAFVKGVQKNNVGVSVKHFALNSNENYRFMGDSICDERAMREIYLKPFEITVKESSPDTVMCAYNKARGSYCSENEMLLNSILREEWRFTGVVMSDWGATHDRVRGIRAGLDLEMPGNSLAGRAKIKDAVLNGALDVSVLDRACERILALAEKYSKNEKNACDFDSHNALAARLATDCAVLLKNNGILPLKCKEKFTVVGELFENMRYQGAGSSMINSTRVTSSKQIFDENCVDYKYTLGYLDNKVCPEDLELDYSGTTVVFAGLTDDYECEGADRSSLSLPEAQLDVINRITESRKRCVVVLFGGSSVELPFADKVDAILYMGLPGQCGGRAVYDLLFGKASPSGRLSESWPISYSDVPCADEYSRSQNEIYRESVFVGYRYYLTSGTPVRYPFGYGLSYTSFEYSDLSVEESADAVIATVTVKNVGKMYGGEVVELYDCAPKSEVFKPLRELRAFKKIYLESGDSKSVTLSFKKSELSYYNMHEGRYVLEGGEYKIEICSDCEHVILSDSLKIEGEEIASPYTERVREVYKNANISAVSDEIFEQMSGLTVPPIPPIKPITLESRFSDLKATFIGRIIYRAFISIPKKRLKKAMRLPEGELRKNAIKAANFSALMMSTNSLNSMSYGSAGLLPLNYAEGFMHLANGRIFKGIGCFLKKIKAPKLPEGK